jgi:hypothetical protein
MTTSTTAAGAVRRATVPSPRPPADDLESTAVLEPVQREPRQDRPQLPEPQYPWPEPWHSYRGARPRSEYWDVATASWHSRGPCPQD